MSAATSTARTVRAAGRLDAPSGGLAAAIGRAAMALVGPAVLALATAAFCWKLLFTGLAVIGYDTMTYMYPYRYFAAMALREGRLPLWNPFIYYGAPFLANVQSAVYYPLHVLFLVLPPVEAMNWSVVVHLFLAALFAYAAARVVAGLDRASATIAGAIYGLGGFVGAQVGHLNQLNAAAWLPAALVTLHFTYVHRSTRWLAATAVVLAVQLLAGHTQESFMTVVLLGAYTAFYGARRSTPWWRSWRSTRQTAPAALKAAAGECVWPAVALTLSGGLAGGLAAMQLLPTSELTGHSIRAGGMSFQEASSFSLPPRELFVGMLPTYGLAGPTSNEYLGWIGTGGLMLSLLGILFRAHRSATFFFAVLGMGSFLLSLGNHFPLHEWLFRVPGMNLFRVPARWALLTSLALAMLAGSGLAFLRQLGRSGWPAAPGGVGPWRRLAAATRLLTAVLIAAGTAAFLWPLQRAGGGPSFGPLLAIWLALGAAVVSLAFWGLAVAPSRWPSTFFALWVLGELFLASRSLEYNNPNPAWVYTELPPVLSALRQDSHPERILSVAATGYHPSDAGRIIGPYGPLLGKNGVEAALINTKYKETLNPNLPMVFGLPSADGYDGGVLPLRRYVDFKRLLVPPEQNLPDSLLRDQVRRVPGPAKLRLFGIKYVIADAIEDVTHDGVFYDLEGTTTVRPGETARFDRLPGGMTEPAPTAVGPVVAVGLVTSLEGASSVPSDTPVARILAGDERGIPWRATLVAGRDTAEGAYTPAARHQQPAPLGPAGAGGSATATYLARFDVDRAPSVSWIAVENLLPAGNVRVHGISLIGWEGRSWPLTLVGEGALRLVHRSDVKLYRHEQALPRAYVVADALVVPDGAAAVEALARPGHDPGRAVVLEREPGVPPSPNALRAAARRGRDRVKAWLGVLDDPRAGTVPASFDVDGWLGASRSGPSDGAQVAWRETTPERITLRVDSTRPGFVVLRDTFFPGWSATVDGEAAPLFRADSLFRAVPVPAGAHTVELRYESRALHRGLAISALALLVVVAVAAYQPPWLRRRTDGAARDGRRRPDDGPLW